MYAGRSGAAWSTRTSSTVDELLGDLDAEGEFDLMQRLAQPLPARVIAKLRPRQADWGVKPSATPLMQ